jgi:hypothetical protein
MPETKATPTFPAIYYNINVPARVVHNPDELAQAGAGWVELDLAAQGLALTPAP